MIQAVLFDLDGTLLDRQSSLIIYTHQQIERCLSLLDGIPLADYLAKLIELDAHGQTTKDFVFRGVEQYFGLPVDSWRMLLEDFLKYFPDTCVPFPKMHHTLQSLQERNLALGLVTNGSNASQNPKIDGLGIRPYFRSVLVSEAEGVKKPNPEIFLRALRQLNVEPEEAVFVGHNPEADIHAARSVGIKAVWMRDSYWPEPNGADATISELRMLPEIVDNLNKQEAQSEAGGDGH